MLATPLVLQLRDHLHPELGARRLNHSQAKHLLDTVQVDANGRVQGHDLHSATIAHLDANEVNIDVRIKSAQERDCQALTSFRTA